jgi:hypothetical protein
MALLAFLTPEGRSCAAGSGFELSARTFFGLVLVFLIARFVVRLFSSPKLAREDWSLYRDKAAATIELDLTLLDAPLRRYGYAPVLEGAEPLRRVLRQAGRRYGGVHIDIRTLMTEGVGIVEVHDEGDELYSEMARYAMLELGRLVPGTTYRDTYSSLTPESTETLEPLLPDKPHYL